MVTHWQLNRADQVRVREWDDGGVIYDAANGNTHLLDPLGLELLDLLRQHAWDLGALVAELAPVMPDDVPASDVPRVLQAKLEQLIRLDLVSPA
ncbi:MAG: HPr-rel-A system PqqD family peptide chaperone [Burkholderiales bacterium]|nr:MAG: HPr-rel-A system PqqD family peptide chaperone [Burkholderiales bacterium]